MNRGKPYSWTIIPFTTAYSEITVFSDGRIGVLFERDNHTKIDLAILPALVGSQNIGTQ